MGKIILVVEDNEVFRRGLERLLVAEGYEPHAFSSAEEALAKMMDCDFAMAVLDVRLPGMHGDDFGVILKQRCQEMPIAFVTSEFTRDGKLQRRIPGCRILSKPIQISQLLGMLHEYVPV